MGEPGCSTRVRFKALICLVGLGFIRVWLEGVVRATAYMLI